MKGETVLKDFPISDDRLRILMDHKVDDTFDALPDPKEVRILAQYTLERLMNDKHEGAPIQMLLWCPLCHARHIDDGAFKTKPHRDHSCQACGLTWRPAKVPTVGVQFLEGYKDAPK